VPYDWPATVRELEQRLKVGALLATAGRIELGATTSEAQPPVDAAPSRLSASDEALRVRLLAEMQQHRGNLTRVAGRMATSRRQVQRWMRRFAIDAATFRD
jgi:transcriptional regulator of acetoin/glycerol metabolism